MLFSQFVIPCPTIARQTSLSSALVYLFLPCKKVHQYHFPRFHIYALVYDICLSLSDLVQSVSKALDSSTSVKLTCVWSFWGLSNIPLCICSTTSLSMHLSMDILVASMPWLCKLCCNKHWGTCLFSIIIISGYMPRRGLFGHMIVLFFIYKETSIVLS